MRCVIAGVGVWLFIVVSVGCFLLLVRCLLLLCGCAVWCCLSFVICWQSRVGWLMSVVVGRFLQPEILFDVGRLWLSLADVCHSLVCFVVAYSC